MYSKRVHDLSKKISRFNTQVLQPSLNQREPSKKHQKNCSNYADHWRLSNLCPYRWLPTYQCLNCKLSPVGTCSTSDLSSSNYSLKTEHGQLHSWTQNKHQNRNFSSSGLHPNRNFSSSGQHPNRNFSSSGQHPNRNFSSIGQHPNRNFSSSGQHPNWNFSSSGQQPIFLKLAAVFGLAWMLYKYFDVESELPLVCVASCSSKEKQRDSETIKEKVPAKIYKAGKRYKDKKKKKKKNREKENEPITATEKTSLSSAIAKAQAMCMLRKDEVGSPGIVICVSVDGKQVYAEGFGYADLENHQPMKPDSVLRIASISKAITATIVAKLWEKNLVDLDEVVQHYVPTFPEKEFMEEKVEIRVRQLLNHTSGIRHYKAADDPVYAYDKPIADLVAACRAAVVSPFFVTSPRPAEATQGKTGLNLYDQKIKAPRENSEFDRGEYLLTRKFKSTKEALTLFENDQLIARPGSKYIYTTFAYTLLAAIVESVTKQPFTETLEKTLRHMGLNETYLDYHDPIIYNRARCYCKDKVGRLVNAPHVDLSYKWAGGGVLSTVEDMVKFGNILLYSAQHGDSAHGLPGYLKASTVSTFWSALGSPGGSPSYGLGFMLTPGEEHYGMCAQLNFGAGHTGAAIGASSALFILPRSFPTPDRACRRLPKASPIPGEDAVAEAESTQSSADLVENVSGQMGAIEPSGKPLRIPTTTSHSRTPSLADSPTYLDTPLLLQNTSPPPAVATSPLDSPPESPSPSDTTPSLPETPPPTETPSPPDTTPSPTETPLLTDTTPPLPLPEDKSPNLEPGPGEVIDFSNIPPGVPLPQGVVVAVFTNMVAVSVRDIAEKVARIFENVDFQK